jgi:Prealbumin-like fold domain
MKGRKTLRRAGIVLGFGALLCAGVMASGAFGMHLDAGTGTTDSTSTATDPAPPPSDSTSTDTTASSSTSTDTTTAPASTTTTPVTYSPKIASDKADYSPGETVTLNGTGWAPSDSVHIFVNDDEGKTWSYSTDVVANASGNLSVQFQLPTTFVAMYSVTASGPISGTATTTFTDGNVTLHLLASEGVANMTVTFDRWNGNTTCSGSPTLSNQTVTVPASSGTVNIPGFGGTGDSIRLKSVSTTTTTKTFSSWTQGDKNTDFGTLVPGSPTPCISNSSGGSNGNLTDGYAHFVNSTATLIVIKHVVNNNGGTATAGNFNMSVTGGSPSPATFAGAESPGTSVTIAANTAYSVGETGPSGYTRSDSPACASATGIAPGGTATCTVTNDDQAATLTVIKHVINNNGGTKAASDFTMSVTGGSPSPTSFAGAESPGTAVTINANAAYSVGESGPSGYTRSDSAGCTSASGLAPGGSATCTITNDDQPATLTVIKHVINNNGGTKAASDFTMSVTGGAPSPASFAGAESPGTAVSINANTAYSVGESGPAGYTRSDSTGCASATGLAPGGSATCTITNDDQAATLTVIKHVINDNGGSASASAFTMSVTGGSPSPGSFSGAESPGTAVTLNAGSYSVGETGPSGYDSSFSADCSGSIANGATKTCTVTNDDKAAHLIVVKHVINDNGGTAAASAFTMTISGVTASGGNSFPGAESPGTDKTLTSIGSYGVLETGPAGYSGSASTDCSGTIALGQTKTCTLTNNDVQPILHVIKHVVNDNGGSSSAADFTLDSGGPNDSPDDFPGNEAGTTVHMDAGSFTVTETGPSGYSASFSANCTGSLAVGDEKTCTVTNDDQPGHLIIKKHVINDNGGSKVASDFTLDSGGTNDSPDNFAGDEGGTNVTLDAGSYHVTETGPSGYTESDSADCSGTIANGETKTCTVTNDDQPGKLIVIKHVINDNGGSKTAADFTLDSGGTNDSPDNFAGSESGTNVTLDAGSYAVTETGPSGYTESDSAGCSGTIANGETKTCTVTNDDEPGHLIVKKHVVNDNGGAKTAADFTLDSGGTNDSPDNFAGDEGGTDVTLDAGSYSVTETGPSGYARSDSADCSGTIANGETKTCTVTNDDQPGHLIVKKHVINDNGGTKTAADFTLDSGGTNDSPDNFAGDESGTDVTLDAGSYSVTETGPSGYTRSDSAACSGTIGNGETKTCTVTNDDQPGHLIVTKHVINDNGGSKVASNFTLDSGGTNDSPSNFAGSESGTNVTLDAGSYSVTETGPSGYTRSDSADCSGTLGNGETKTCTVTNDDQPAHLIVTKHVINDNGGTKTAGDFTLDSGGTNDSPSNFAGDEAGTNVTLDAGSYSVTETGPSGYARSNSAYCSGTIGNGETKTCTVTNDDIQPVLHVIKHVVNDNGGTASASNFTMTVTGSSPSPASSPGAESPGTTVHLNAGSYSVSESGPSGYADSYSADCSGSVSVGDEKTCTVTNNDIQPKLYVIKHVVNDNGGTATASQFTMSVTGSSPSPASFAGAESPGTQVALNAGTYSVSENGPTGYAQSSTADCTGSISVGQTKTCTFTNDDIQPKLIVIKHVINDDGGPKSAADFTLTVTGNNPSPASFAGAESPGTNVAIDAGSYSVTEGAHTGYAVSYSTDCASSLTIGQTKTCTVTNDDDNQPPVITSFVGTTCLFGPLVFVPCTFSGTFTDSAVADNPWAVAWSWDGTADPSANQSVGANATTNHAFGPQTHTYTSSGCGHTATVQITDKDGAFDTKTVGVLVGTGAFLPPMTNQPVTNKLKNGQVLPVKIQITDCNGAGVNNLQPAIRLVDGDQTTAFDDSAVAITPDSVSSADTTGFMRSSGSDGSYIYNMRVNVAKLNSDYTVVIYPYGTTAPNDKLTLRHVIQATK